MNFIPFGQTCANYSDIGANKTKMALSNMFLLAILAGFQIGIPAAVTNMASYGFAENNSLVRIISGLLFAFGLGTVVLAGTELCTGNTLISISCLDRKASIGGMLKNWLVVYIGNFIGCLLVAYGCAMFGWASASENLLAAFCMKVAVAKMSMPFQNAFVMGIFCNVLVTLGVLLSLMGKDVVSRVLGAWIPVMFFVVCGFSHSIADMAYCMLGLFAGRNEAYLEAARQMGVAVEQLTWGNYFQANLIPVTLGNLVGGVLVGWLCWFCFLRKKRS